MVTATERRSSSKLRASWDHVDLSGVLHSVELDMNAETIPNDNHNEAGADGSFKNNEAAKNLKILYGLLDGSAYDEAKFKAAFAQAFDKDATALTFPADTSISDLADPSKRVELDYNGIFEQVVSRYAKMRYPVENMSIRPLFKGVFEYSLQGRYRGHEATIVSHAWVRDNKIVRIERMDTFLRELPKAEDAMALATPATADSMLNVTKAQKTRIRRASQLLPEAGPNPRKAEQGRIKHSSMLLPDGPAYNKVLKGRVRHGSQLLPHTLEHRISFE